MLDDAIDNVLEGYRMRTHIAKSLQSRCKAIRTAIQVYNKAAAALSPPRPVLDWDTVSHFSFLEEFHLLLDIRGNAHSQIWAQPVYREAMRRSCRIRRAREEIDRCNLEIRRIFSSIHSEHSFFSQLLVELQQSQDPLYGAIHEYILRREQVNALLLSKLVDIQSLRDFTGSLTVGRRKGTSIERSTEPAYNGSLHSHTLSKLDIGDEDSDSEEEIGDTLNRIIDFISSLSI